MVRGAVLPLVGLDEDQPVRAEEDPLAELRLGDLPPLPGERPDVRLGDEAPLGPARGVAHEKPHLGEI